MVSGSSKDFENVILQLVSCLDKRDLFKHFSNFLLKVGGTNATLVQATLEGVYSDTDDPNAMLLKVVFSQDNSNNQLHPCKNCVFISEINNNAFQNKYKDIQVHQHFAKEQRKNINGNSCAANLKRRITDLLVEHNLHEPSKKRRRKDDWSTKLDKRNVKDILIHPTARQHMITDVLYI